MTTQLIASASVNWFTGWKFGGHFTTVDLIAASTNSLNGALLARHPDHYETSRSSACCAWACSWASAAASPATCS